MDYQKIDYSNVMLLTTAHEVAHYDSIIETDDLREFYIQGEIVATIHKRRSQRIDFDYIDADAEVNF